MPALHRLGAIDRPSAPADIGARRGAPAALLAGVLLVVSTLGSLMEQSRIDEAERGSHASASGGDPLALGSHGAERLVGAYVGAPYTYPSDVHVTKPGQRDVTFERVTWDAFPFTNPIYYGARVANWTHGGRYGVMVDFIHSKTIADMKREVEAKGTIDGAPVPSKVRVGEMFRRLEFSHGHNMLMATGLVRLADLGPRVRLYAGAGAGASLPHTELHLARDKSRTYEYQYAGLAGQALVGLEFRLPRASVFVEYKFTFARNVAPLTGDETVLWPVDLWRQFNRWWSGRAPRDGFLATSLASHQIVGGVGVRIGYPGSVAAR